MIDTHCHLLSLDTETILKNMKVDGLEKLVTISTTVNDSQNNVKLAEENCDVYATVGIYPEYADGITDDDLNKIEELCKSDKVVAIGEIGLDYHTEGFNSEKQKEIFVKQLKIASKHNLPFCIHCRNAAADVYEILKEYKPKIDVNGLMHCYSEGNMWIDKFLELGMYISFSGNITFKKSDRSFLNRIPLDKFLVETDSPYLSPEPFRGRPNEPKNTRYVINLIADELGISASEFEQITTKNAKEFYNIKEN